MALINHKLWITGKDYVMIVVAIVLYAFGFCAFILPQDVVMGGVSGVAALIYYCTGLPVAVSQVGINAILLIIGYRILGRSYVIRTVFGVAVIGISLGIFQPLFPEPLIEGQPFMCILIGAVFCGASIGIAYTHNGSTGGTDVVAAMVAKRTNVSIGRALLFIDVVIICSSWLLFHSIDKIIYGLVIEAVITYVTDLIVNSNRQAVQFTIFSARWEEIANIVNTEAKRGVTVIDAMGWYSRKPMKMLMVMCRRIEAVTIYRIVKSVDPEAFITQTRCNGVYGKGFDTLKLKLRPEDVKIAEEERQAEANQNVAK